MSLRSSVRMLCALEEEDGGLEMLVYLGEHYEVYPGTVFFS